MGCGRCMGEGRFLFPTSPVIPIMQILPTRFLLWHRRQAAWVQILQHLTSAQGLSKSNALRLAHQPRTRVPLPAGPLTAAVASHNVLP